MSHGGMELGCRMKMYESLGTSQRLMPRLPVLARIDGRAFHTFCRGMEKPFDDTMLLAMGDTTRELVREFKPLIAHVCSDEISLVFCQEKPESEMIFGGKLFKMQSVLASAATAHFNHWWPEARKSATFDCRVWQVPNADEVVNYLIWREQDAARNSISAVAQSHFSHKQLHKKNTSDMHEMLMAEKGVNWNDLEDGLKRGRYFRRTVREVPLDPAEWEKIPEKHRPPKDQKVQRTVVVEHTFPRLTTITNRVEVIFTGAVPEIPR